MDTHKNARLTWKGREEMVRAVVDRGKSNAAAARQFNTTPKTVGKWVGRFCAEGVDGLRDRSSRPLSSPSQIPLAIADAVEHLRRERRTQEHIAAEIGISRASVSRILKRRGLSRLSSLELQEPHPRYEREKPGEIIHLDIKKLGRFSSVGHRVTGRRTGYCSSQGAGWEFVHVAIDDHSRIARAEILPDQKKESAVAFLVATVAYFRSLGITVERVMTDNGSCYLSKAFARACKQLAVKHIRIKPYTPQTNGKAERFIQTALREWAYATAYEHSEQRYAALPAWRHRYNWHRPHVSLARKPPISRLGLTGDNLLRLCPGLWGLGFNEQIFGTDEQNPGPGPSDQEAFGPTVSPQLVQSGKGRIASDPALLNLPRPLMAGAFSVHGSDKQMFGVNEQILVRGPAASK